MMHEPAATVLSERNSAPNLSDAMPEVAENLLIRVKPLKPQYPREALIRNIEGWVEIGYTVTDAGKVIGVKALSSSPVGVFEAAAMEAVSRMRYQPVKQAGKTIAVDTKIRVSFRLSAG